MKNTIFVTVLIIFFVLISCNNIPDKSISEKLTTEELFKAIKSDTTFSRLYDVIRAGFDKLEEVEKSKYSEISYRRLSNYINFLEDTVHWKPFRQEWESDWNDKYGGYLNKADSVINYWKKYLNDNSLDKYVKIELSVIDKKYYEYVSGISDVRLGFKLTPLQGKIDQIRFYFGYSEKINENDDFYLMKRIQSTSSFSTPIVIYWEVGSFEKDQFSNHSVETFLNDYNLYFEIIDICKDGKNISKDDFGLPELVSDYFRYDKDDKYDMQDYYIEKIVKELIFKDYLSKEEYVLEKRKNIDRKNDKLCFDLFIALNEVSKNKEKD